MKPSQENLVVKEIKRFLDCSTRTESLEEMGVKLRILCFYLPDLLSKKYEFWKEESLDGIDCLQVCITENNKVELFGMCYLITDYTQTPIYIDFKVKDSSNDFEYIHCKIGENTPKGLLRLKGRIYDRTPEGKIIVPGRTHPELEKYLNKIKSNTFDPNIIEWFFEL